MRQVFNYPRIISAEIIQGRKLFKGGNYKLLGGFDCGNYSRAETIRGNTVCHILRQNKELLYGAEVK